MRNFDTGATRDTADDKPDYQGFLSPYAIARFGAYMQSHQRQADGTIRASDNWKKGIPMDVYVKSLYRHVIEFMMRMDEGDMKAADEALQGVLFNAMGWSHEAHKPSGPSPLTIENSVVQSLGGGANKAPAGFIQWDKPKTKASVQAEAAFASNESRYDFLD